MANEPIVQLRNVTKLFFTKRVETTALDRISIDVGRGEFLAITGASGCGKSTLLSILGLLESQSSGEYLFEGRTLERATNRERSAMRRMHFGFIFQGFHLAGDLTVAENVALPLVFRGLSRKERGTQVDIAVERVGLSARSGHYPAQLSGGQQQRVAVARAFASRPDLLLADEPTGNLDSENAEAVMGLLEELHAEGATVVLVTHDNRFAARAQRAVHLVEGRLT